MGFDIQWEDDAKTLIRYKAVDAWNWTDFHRAVRLSTFGMGAHDGPVVDTIVDFSQTARIPGGALAHIRSAGKRHVPQISGRAIIIGLPPEIEAKLLAGSPKRELNMREQHIYFVDDEAAAQTLLHQLRADAT